MSPHLLRKFLNHGKFLGGWRWVQENYICKQNISCSRAAALVAPWSRLVLLPPSGIFPFTPALLSPTNVQKQTTLLLIALRGAPDARQTPGSIIFFGLGRAGGGWVPPCMCAKFPRFLHLKFYLFICLPPVEGIISLSFVALAFFMGILGTGI